MDDIKEYTRDDFLMGTEPYEFLYGYIGDKFTLERMQERMCAVAKAVKVNNFKKLFSEYCKKKKQLDNTLYLNNVTQFEGQELELECGAWRADEYGISIETPYGEQFACPHPILPVMRLKNVDTGLEKLKLSFRRGMVWKSVMADKKTLASSNLIVSLADSGIAVNSENAKYLVRYISDVENLNYERIPEKNSVNRMGWIGADTFSPYVEDLIFEGDEGYTTAFKAIHEQGSYEQWKREVQKCREYSKVTRIILSASFASVLVKKVDALSFFVHLWGSTSGVGKTVGLMLAASVWASPVMGEYVRTFNSTIVGNEQAAGFVNNMPLIMDEFQLNKNKKDFEQIVYMLSEGVGKTRGARSGGIQRTLMWRNCILTSGEMPITNFMTGAGAFNRIIELECTQPLFQSPTGTLAVILKNYGFAGKEFVMKLLEEGNIEKANTLYDQYYHEIIESDTTEKQAMAGAVILTADALINEWIFPGSTPLTAADMGEFLHTRAEVDINERAYNYLCEAVEMNLNRFNMENENGEIWGKIQDGKAYIIRSAFERLCAEEGYSSQAILSWLKNRGLVETSRANTGGRNPIPTRSVKIKGSTVRCVVMTLKSPEVEDVEMLPDE